MQRRSAGISSSNLNRGGLSIGTSGISLHLRHDPDQKVGCIYSRHGWWLSSVGTTLAAGGSLRWYRVYLPHITYTELMDLLARCRCPWHSILPHLSGERSPHLDPDTCGAWVNLSLAHTQADLIRAVLRALHSACGQLWR